MSNDHKRLAFITGFVGLWMIIGVSIETVFQVGTIPVAVAMLSGVVLDMLADYVLEEGIV